MSRVRTPSAWVVAIAATCLLGCRAGSAPRHPPPAAIPAGWNVVMAHLIAQTAVYWVEEPLHVWLDVIPPGAANATGGLDGGGAAFLQVAWHGVHERASHRPGDLLPAPRDAVLAGLSVSSQQITLQPRELRAEFEAAGGAACWRMLVVQAISASGHVVAEDWLPVQLVGSYVDASSRYGFPAPPAPRGETPAPKVLAPALVYVSLCPCVSVLVP